MIKYSHNRLIWGDDLSIFNNKKVETNTKLIEPKNPTLAKMSKYKFLYLVLAPALLLVLVFCYLPMFGLVMAFQEYDIIGGIMASDFVGFDNFVKIFTMPKFTKAIINTIKYSSVQIFLGLPFPIVLALLFNEMKNLKFKKFAQTVSYLPYFLSWISVIGMFSAMFALDGTYNDIMEIIVGEGYVRKNILTDADNFTAILFWSNEWKNIGWNSIIFLAAITGIDSTLYEAAMVDGCGRLKQIWYITIPCLLPTIAIIFIMNTASLVTLNFEQVFGFQNVYIQEETEVINTLVYRQGILNAEYSLSTAFGLVQGVVSFALVFITNKIVKKFSGIGIW